MTEREADKLAVSREPSDWLVSFDFQCRQAQRGRFSLSSLYASLVMLGVGPDINGDEWSIDKPADFDQQAHRSIVDAGMLLALRSAARSDLHSIHPEPGFEDYGKIGLKVFSRWLLYKFLVGKPDFGGRTYEVMR